MQVERESGAIHEYSGVRVSNTWVIYLLVWNNPGKPGLIPHKLERGKQQCAERGARGRLASWQGKSLPRRRSVAGLRGRTATLALKHGPDSYGRQQWGILHNAERVMQQRRVRDEGLRVVNLFRPGKMGPRRTGSDGTGGRSPGQLRASSRGNT